MGKKIPVFQIDAFTGRVFAGNPAAVCPLEEWLNEVTLQAIAAENNLSETAFFVPRNTVYELRWFTPAMEVDLCGHATLAAAFVILEFLDRSKGSVDFETRSGRLSVRREGDLLSMDFPSRPATPLPVPAGLAEALGRTPVETGLSRDLMAVFGSEDEVRGMKPDFARLEELPYFAVIVTAPGREADFVSRFFAPRGGILEDPVTGSAHCTLIPYWSRRLGKTKLHARQVSARGGELYCENQGERVTIAGRAVRFLEGAIFLD
jgi:PhzF family phenazine biosynthesis protein